MTHPAQATGPAPSAGTGPGRDRPRGGRPARDRHAARGGGESRGRRGAQAPYLLVVAGAAAGLAWMWHGGGQHVRGGTLAVAGALLMAALARLVLPEGWAGMLASRRRFIDVVTLATLAIGLLAAGLLLPAPS